MTRTLQDLLPAAAVECVRDIDRVRGREVATALVGFLLFCDVRECHRQAMVESTRKPAVSAGPRYQAQVQVQERML